MLGRKEVGKEGRTEGRNGRNGRKERKEGTEGTEGTEGKSKFERIYCNQKRPTVYFSETDASIFSESEKL